MARVSKCDKLPEQERLRLIGRIADGISWRELAKEFGIPAATIREWSERHGHGRNPVEAKRQMVDVLLAKPETAQQFAHCAASTGNPDIDAGALRDADAARLASGVAMNIIRRLDALVRDGEPDGREAASIAGALDKAWGTYARINKLDDVKTDSIVIDRSYGKMTPAEAYSALLNAR